MVARKTSLGESTGNLIDNRLLSKLQQHVASREVEQGIQCLEAHHQVIADLSPAQQNAARLIAQLAIWIDIGFNSPPLPDLLKRFQSHPATRSKLSMGDYICLRIAEGMSAMREESMESAIAHFDFVLSLSAELHDQFLLAIVYFWKARCLRRRGEYDEAIIFTSKGKQLALEQGHARMAAVMQVLEGWLLFQQGKWKEALRVTKAAEVILRETDDSITLGNIQSFYGRLARREGRFDKAIEYFENAIRDYEKRDPEHPNLARSLANMALAKRGIALQLQKRVDRDAAKRRKGPSGKIAKRASDKALATGVNPSAIELREPDHRKLGYLERLAKLRSEALDHLEVARAIYRRRPNYHGAGTLHLNASYIHLDGGDFQRAEEEAASAYDVAEQKQDYILMVRARILQCMIENAKVEEDVSEGADPGSCARRALEFSQEAIKLAKQTQHHLLLARAYVWLGLTECNSFFDNPEAARETYDLARASYGTNPPDNNILQELQTLGGKILHKGSVHPTLKAWSQGAVGEKTFRQISEEFAEIVIPRVWEREGRKVSRVAARLSISPKKVRRILARVGRRKPQK
jgi:tetratricopeptide (TPR) repeat protein